MPTWNVDYAGRKWSNLGADEPWANFQKAYNDRMAAALNSGPSTAVEGTLCITFFAITSGPGWDHYRDTFPFPWFVRKFKLDGSPWTPADGAGIDSVTTTVDPTFSTLSNLAFPYPDGFTRRYRREIWSLANAGLGGQRARFVYMGGFGQPWRSCDTIDAAYNTNPVTPPAECGNAPFFYDHNGTTWVRSPDQVTPADKVEQANILTLQRGDVFDARFANELQEAFNQIVRTAGDVNTSGSPFDRPDTPAGNYIFPVVAYFHMSTLSGTDYLTKGAGSFGADPPGADDEYDAGTGSGAGGGEGISYVYKEHTWNGYNIIEAVSQKPTFTGAPNMNGMNRDIEWWVWPQVPAGRYFFIGFGFSGETHEFDAYGSGFADRTWQSTGSTVATAATALTGPRVGGVPAAHPIPWPTDTSNAIRGWGVGIHTVIINWDVPGGFTHQAP